MNVLEVAAALPSLAVLRDRAREAAASAGLEPDAANRLIQAVDEIATNIIVHGYEENGLSGTVTMRCELAAHELVIALEDSAPAFDPRARAMPREEDLNRPLEERPIGGLGVYLAMRGVDRFDYERAGGKNRTILAMRRAGVSPEEP